MFTVGEFARIAQVSKRLLRYYDEIGLLKPVQIDKQSGYRLYSAEQMPDLNRILALKELGLSLDQIRQMLSNHVSLDEMQGMLLLKKSEIEQQLQAELQRIRKIESRLQSIRDTETAQPLNVVIKSVDLQPVLSLRTMMADFEHGMELFAQVRRTLPEKKNYGFIFCICHSHSIRDYDLDMEIGCLISSKSHDSIMMTNDLELHYRELPGADTMATIVVKGALETIHSGYTRIGQWVERNDYQLAGIPREITLQLPQHIDGSDLITEIQFPVEMIS